MKYPNYKLTVEPQLRGAAVRKKVQSRWSVKTGADNDAVRVDITSSADTAISGLISQSVPG